MHYRTTGWREPVSLATFRQQMASYARGEELRRLRIEKPTEDGKRLSQEDAAHEIGVTAKTLRAWEGGGPIKPENAKKAAAFYGVEPADVAARDQEEDLGPAHAEIRRIERKLDALLAHFDLSIDTVSEAIEAFEAETDDVAEQRAEQAPPRRRSQAA